MSIRAAPAAARWIAAVRCVARVAGAALDWAAVGSSLYLRGNLLRNGVCRVWVEVRAEIVGRQTVIKEGSDWDHHVGWRHFDLDLIEPAPDVHLADLGIWNALADAARQIDLATGQLDRFEKGLL